MKSDNTQTKIKDLQLFEQNMQSLAQQKQQFQSQLFEVESAISEISKTDTSFKIIGNIMVKVDKKILHPELKEREEILNLRIKSIVKQEKLLGEKAVTLQKEVMEELKKEEKNNSIKD